MTLYIRKHLQILGKDDGILQKWHFRYKSSDISETIKRSEPKFLQGVYRNSCTAYRLFSVLVSELIIQEQIAVSSNFVEGLTI